jgi:hypothetical protein
VKRTRRGNANGSQRPPTQSRSRATYSVGYSKPPREHQFQPGQSGNPKGRPKGAKNTANLLRDILDRKVEMRTSGTLSRVSVREAMLTRFAEAALKGDVKAAGFLLQRYDAAEAGDEHARDIATQDEQKIIDAFLQSYPQAKGEQK